MQHHAAVEEQPCSAAPTPPASSRVPRLDRDVEEQVNERPSKAPRLTAEAHQSEPGSSQDRRVRPRLQWEGDVPLPPDPNPGWEGHRVSTLQDKHEPFPFVCTRCGRRSKSADALSKIPCEGRAAGARLVHASHLLYQTGDFVFCNRCGGHGVAVVSKLKSPCQGDQGLSNSAKDRLGRLRRGRSPRDPKLFLGTPVRLD